MFNNVYISPLAAVAKIRDTIAAGRADSLVKYTQSTRVEPLTLVDSSLLNLPYMDDVMRGTLGIYAGYYLQAVAASTVIGGVEIVRFLDKLNPNRDPLSSAGLAFANKMMATESYNYGLPILRRSQGLESLNVGLEMDGDDIMSHYAKMGTADYSDVSGHKGKNLSGAEISKDAIALSNSLDYNLAVGALLDVKVQHEGHIATIPVNVRLMSVISSPDVLRGILTHAEVDLSVKERFHAIRSGEIEAIKDGIFCNDLIEDHRRAMIKDKTGLYRSVVERRNKNGLASIISGNISVNQASNIMVISKSTIDAIQRELSGRFTDFTTRQRIFDRTELMLLVVVDQDMERVTIYHRGIADATTVTVRAMKGKSKSGPDVAEILKAYQMSHSPSF